MELDPDYHTWKQVSTSELDALENEIADVVLQLGLQDTSTEQLSFSRCLYPFMAAVVPHIRQCFAGHVGRAVALGLGALTRSALAPI